MPAVRADSSSHVHCVLLSSSVINDNQMFLSTAIRAGGIYTLPTSTLSVSAFAPYTHHVTGQNPVDVIDPRQRSEDQKQKTIKKHQSTENSSFLPSAKRKQDVSSSLLHPWLPSVPDWSISPVDIQSFPLPAPTTAGTSLCHWPPICFWCPRMDVLNIVLPRLLEFMNVEIWNE